MEAEIVLEATLISCKLHDTSNGQLNRHESSTLYTSTLWWSFSVRVVFPKISNRKTKWRVGIQIPPTDAILVPRQGSLMQCAPLYNSKESQIKIDRYASMGSP